MKCCLSYQKPYLDHQSKLDFVSLSTQTQIASILLLDKTRCVEANFMKFKFERGPEQFLCLVVFTFQEESDAKLVIIRIDRCLKLGLANT